MDDKQIAEEISVYIQEKYPELPFVLLVVTENACKTVSTMNSDLMIELFEKIVKEHKKQN